MEVYQSLLNARSGVSDIACAIVAAHIALVMLGAVPKPADEATPMTLMQSDNLYTYFGPRSLKELCDKQQDADGVFCALRYTIFDSELNAKIITISFTCIDGSLIIAQVVEFTDQNKRPVHCGTASSALEEFRKDDVFDPKLAIISFREKFRDVLFSKRACGVSNCAVSPGLAQSSPSRSPVGPGPQSVPQPPRMERVPPPYGLNNMETGYNGMLVGPDHRIFQSGMARFDPIRPDNPFDNPNLHPDPDDIRGVLNRRRFDY